MRAVKSDFGSRQAAFTLLEVLVALMVTTLFLVTLSPVSYFALGRVSHATDKTRALFLARSKLEEASLQLKDSVGSRKGLEGGLTWELDVHDLHSSENDDASAGVLLREWRIRVIHERSAGPLADLAMQRIYIDR